MTEQFASLGGVRIVSGTITIPLYGMWSGDVSLATGDVVPDDADLVLGNLTLRGHVYRQALFAGGRTCRLVAGHGGWRTVVPAKQYSLASGVALSLVLRDAAMEVGESVNVPNDQTIGVAYVREQAQASRVLRQLAGANWYVDPAGVTQIKAWPTAQVTTTFTPIDQRGAAGVIVIATEDYAAWMPGKTFAAPTLDTTYAVGGVRYAFEGDGRFRLEVMVQ